jgi:hypothetical protein
MSTLIYNTVTLQLRLRHTDWTTTLNTAVLNNITGITPPTRLDTSSWKLPTDINLADKYFNQPGGIDLLIGADLFYEMLQPGRRTRPGDYPVLQETVLGWTVAGQTPANTTLEDVKYAFLLGTSQWDHVIFQFWEAESMELSTNDPRQKAGEHLHTHNSTKGGGVVNNHPTRMESHKPRTPLLSERQGPTLKDQHNSSGRADQPTTSRACSSANLGNGQPQSTIWRSRPGEGGQPLTTPLASSHNRNPSSNGRQHDNTKEAYSCDHQHPSTSDGINPVATQENQKTPPQTNLTLTACE